MHAARFIIPWPKETFGKTPGRFYRYDVSRYFNRKFYPGYKTVTLRILPDPAMFLQPFVTGFSLFGIDPVAGIEVEMQLFRCGNNIVRGIHRRIGGHTTSLYPHVNQPGTFTRFAKLTTS